MEKKGFREWDLDKIDDAFGTKQVRKLAILEELLSFEYQADDYETRYLSKLINIKVLISAFIALIELKSLVIDL